MLINNTKQTLLKTRKAKNNDEGSHLYLYQKVQREEELKLEQELNRV